MKHPYGGAYEASEASRELPAGQEMTREAGLLFLFYYILQIFQIECFVFFANLRLRNFKMENKDCLADLL